MGLLTHALHNQSPANTLHPSVGRQRRWQPRAKPESLCPAEIGARSQLPDHRVDLSNAVSGSIDSVSAIAVSHRDPLEIAMAVDSDSSYSLPAFERVQINEAPERTSEASAGKLNSSTAITTELFPPIQPEFRLHRARLAPLQISIRVQFLQANGSNQTRRKQSVLSIGRLREIVGTLALRGKRVEQGIHDCDLERVLSGLQQ